MTSELSAKPPQRWSSIIVILVVAILAGISSWFVISAGNYSNYPHYKIPGYGCYRTATVITCVYPTSTFPSQVQ